MTLSKQTRELLKARLLATKARVEAEAAEEAAVEALQKALIMDEMPPDGVHVVSLAGGEFFLVRFTEDGLVWIDELNPGVIAI